MDTIENQSVPPALVTEPEVTPPLPLGKPKGSSPIIPILFGVVFVVIISAVLAGLYYFARLKKEVADASPSPIPSLVASPSIEPSSTASSSASPKGSVKPVASASLKPSSTPKPTPTPTPKPSASVTPTPTPQTTTSTLDIRFGNPSAHVKQTYDDGSGDGRVINREYSSIQVGDFDEIKAAWTPKVTVCFHVITNQDLEGAKLGYTITEDDKTVSEGTLSQYTKMEAGKIYDVCHDTSLSLGAHKVQLNINNTKSLSESTFANNLGRIDFRNLADNIAPNFTLMGPNNEGSNGTCLFPQYISDNVTLVTALKIEQKVDGGDWTTFPGDRYCFKGTTGSSHTYGLRIIDARGNKNEQSSTFNLF